MKLQDFKEACIQEIEALNLFDEKGVIPGAMHEHGSYPGLFEKSIFNKDGNYFEVTYSEHTDVISLFVRTEHHLNGNISLRRDVFFKTPVTWRNIIADLFDAIEKKLAEGPA